jgi:single-strand DNA-binding protein
MNKVILLGRLTKAPEIRYSQTTNTKIALFTLAVNRRFAKQGEERETDFINIVAYSKLADFSEKYLSQGTQVNVVGRLQNRSYEDKNGTKKYISEIIAEEIYFADSKKKADESILWQNNSNNTQVTDTTGNIDGLFDSADDLPF